MQGFVNEPIALRAQLHDDNTSAYVRATVTNSVGAAVVLDLAHVAAGLYSVSYTPAAIGALTISYRVYKDAGYTHRDSKYLTGVDFLDVLASRSVFDQMLPTSFTAGSFGEAMALLLGLAQQNYVLDNTTHNAKGLLTSGRIRLFPTASDATAETNAFASYQITTVPELAPQDGFVEKYKVVKL